MKNIFKELKLMKKLLLFIVIFLAPFSLIASAQDGTTIPDAIELYNSSDATIEVCGSKVQSQESISLDATQGSFTIKSGKRTYKISHPTAYDHRGSFIAHTPSTACLDFSTIQWLAGDINKLFPGGLDSISITNDSYYPIAIVYVLNKMRTRSRSIDPQETVSKVVSTDDNQRTGFLELIDGKRKKHTFSFPRRIYNRSLAQQSDWREITLRAQTIAWFDKGFKVTIR